MKYLNAVLGIISLCFLLFYHTLDIPTLEIDLQDLSSKGSIEFIDGKVYFTMHDTLSIRDVKTLQRLDSLFELQIIDPNQLGISDNHMYQTRGPP